MFTQLCKWQNRHIHFSHSPLKICYIYFVLCRILSLEVLEPADFDGFKASTTVWGTDFSLIDLTVMVDRGLSNLGVNEISLVRLKQHDIS